MAFTEFCCRSGGSNLYAGTLDGSAEPSTTPLVTYTGGTWVASTGVFTVASGNPTTAGVAVGHWVSVYADGSSAPTGFVGRVTARDTTTITVSLTAKSGTAPTNGTSNRTLVVGGAWAGPSGASGFPFGFALAAMTDAAADPVRVNFKNDQTYSVTATAAHNVSGGAQTFSGYATAFGDGGRVILDGGSPATAFTLLNVGTNITTPLLDAWEWRNNGSGNASYADGIVLGALGTTVRRTVVHGMQGFGIALSNSRYTLVNVEGYACNQTNTFGVGAVSAGDGTVMRRCVFHDNTGNVACGVAAAGNTSFEDCIFDSNGWMGVYASGGVPYSFVGCDFYNNGSDAIHTNNATGTLSIESCNFVKNGGFAISGYNAGIRGFALNCGFGSGAVANTSGTVDATVMTGVSLEGSVTYASGVTPWVDPVNGDFRINLAAAKGAGRGDFLETASGYAGTVGYPDIGAAQHQDAGGGGSGPAGVLRVFQNIGTY